MNEQVSLFLEGWFSADAKGDPEADRRSIHNSSADYQRTVRDGLAEIIRTRSLTTDEFWEITFVALDSEDELYRQLQEAYDYVYGDDRPAE